MTPPSLARRLLLLTGVAVVWTIAVAGTLAVAHWTRLGAVVLRLSHRHGIHEGDLATMCLLGGLALAASVWLGRRLLLQPAGRSGPAHR